MNLVRWFRTFSVRTLDEPALQEAANDLLRQASGQGAPNIILGIRTGGFIVAERMMNHAAPDTNLLAITRRRPSTQTKQDSGLFKKALAFLPYSITDRLRVIEHGMLMQNAAPAKPMPAFSPDPREMEVLQAHLDAMAQHANILVVDDSVDSGATLAAILYLVRKAAHAEAKIHSAAITVTTPTPLLQPDFFLYRHVLCRFPWSFDFKR